MTEERLPIVAILGDSRVFDTYYLNDAYGDGVYGYDRTFPHILRRELLTAARPVADAVHIPDHFRGRTVENNILRLALTDPAVVVLVDGIWETLLSKRHFLEYVEAELGDAGRDAEIGFTYSAEAMLDLYRNDRLSLSPSRYAERVRSLVSYFTRRRRKVVWATLPITPKDHLGGLHYAGNYRPVPGWSECLAHVNATVVPEVEAVGGTILDLDGLMTEAGGASACLVDQWHFTPHFHARIAAEIAAIVAALAEAGRLEPGAAARAVVLPRPAPGLEVALAGDVVAGRAAMRDLDLVEAPAEAAAGRVHLLAAEPGRARDLAATELLAGLSPADVVVYPEELGPIDNPTGNDRREHGTLK